MEPLEETDKMCIPEKQASFDSLYTSFRDRDIHCGFSRLIFVVRVTLEQ